jgi:hypothetical protein
MRFAKIVVGLIFAVFVFSAVAGAQVVVTDDANTSSTFPTTNFGSSVALIVGSGSNTYIKFSLANLGSGVIGSNVSKGTLILYVDAVLASGTMDVYQVNGSWSEGKITYNSAPALGTQLFSAVSVSGSGYLSLDLTSTVQSWLNGTLANNGIALVPTPGSKISVSFDSKENIFTSHTAQLPLVLVSAGPQGPQGPQGSQGATGPQGPAGPSGAPGATGPQGAQGPQGSMGSTGPQGPQGTPGTAGSNGLPGAAATVQVGTVTTGSPGSQASVTNIGTANAAVLNFSIPQGAPGSGGSGFNGIQEFTQSGTFTVPAGVTSALVELWGAGGGAGSTCDIIGPTFGGSGGGGGYSRAVISLTPGAAYSVTIGAGGTAGGGACGVAGGDGGATQLLDGSSNVLASAGGGGGGASSAYGGPGGSGGAAGSGQNVVGRSGTGGGVGTSSSPGAAGNPPAGSIQLPNGAGVGSTSQYSAGFPGYVLITF